MPDPILGTATTRPADGGASAGFAARTSAALGTAESLKDGPAVWRALGEHGLLAELRSDQPFAERNLAELLAALDARCPVGVVLSVCVQVATSLPLLAGHLAGGLAGHRAGGPTGHRAGGPVVAAHEAGLAGVAVLALAATDGAGAGSDLMSLGTTARLTDDRVVLDGTKKWITNACTADYALVLARHRPQRHFTSFLWVLVPMDAPGVSAAGVGGDTFAGSGVGSLRFDGVELGLDHLIGRPGRGLATFARHVATERLAGGLWAAAMCRRVLTETHRQLTTRTLGAAALWDNPAVRERYARCVVEAWCIEAACAAFQSSPDRLVASMLLKTAVADRLDTVLGECARLVGAEAFVEGGLAELRTAAAMFATAGGATGAMLHGIAEHVPDLLEARLP